MMRPCVWLILLLVLASPWSVRAAGEGELESGWLWVGRADVRIPGDDGTRFSFTDDLDPDSGPYLRGRVSWRSAPRHYWALTVVPLEATASGTLARDTLFVDTEFPAGTRVKASYRFNNYRLTYRYRAWDRERLTFDVGATLFVRDAKVTLESADLRDADDDLGVVPLISFGAEWKLCSRLSVVLDGDALVADQGRALDVLLALQYAWEDRLQVGAGYRILEGGADNDDVYPFALFHHAALYLRGAW